MTRTYNTIRECAELWVSQMNAFPYGMIKRLVDDCPDEWHEVTYPAVGDRVYVYDLPDECDTLEYGGEIESIDDEKYHIKLDDGTCIETDRENLEVEYDGALPMWGWMWQFSDSCDDWWLEEGDGVQKMSECGFRVYEHDEFGYFFGIDGAGYDFYEAHWEPLYKARGLRWHNEAAEEEYQMTIKGYTKGMIGGKEYWLDGKTVIKEVMKA